MNQCSLSYRFSAIVTSLLRLVESSLFDEIIRIPETTFSELGTLLQVIDVSSNVSRRTLSLFPVFLTFVLKIDLVRTLLRLRR